LLRKVKSRRAAAEYHDDNASCSNYVQRRWVYDV